MALIPHKADPNFDRQMAEYRVDNSRWGGSDMSKGLDEKPSEEKPVPGLRGRPKKTWSGN